jgi:DUF971 family protein
MDLQPVNLALGGDGRLVIDWSDGTRREYTLTELREKCPCATCREKRVQAARPQSANLLPVLSAAEVQPLRLVEMKPVGHYAYAIHFSDGHNTGIYTFELLRELGRETGGTAAGE